MNQETLSLATLGEHISTADFRLGEAVGMEKAAALVLELSKAAFGEGNDKRAHEMRDISRMLKEKALMAREETSEFAAVRRSAFDELARRDSAPVTQ